MLFRSTGLGKTMLIGEVAEMKREGNYLIMHVDTTEPVQWRIRAAMSFKDLAKVGMACGKASIISFLLSPSQWFRGEPERIEDF